MNQLLIPAIIALVFTFMAGLTTGMKDEGKWLFIVLAAMFDVMFLGTLISLIM